MTTRPNILAAVSLWVFLLTGSVHGVSDIYAHAYTTKDSIRITRTESDTAVVESEPSYVALKNNLLYDAIATPNLQAEFRLNDHFTLQLGAGFNPFPLDDKVIPKWRHVEVEIAPRYWFCEAFTRDFLSMNMGYVHYNVAGGKYPIGWMYKDVQTNRFQGDALLLGASYGWHFALSPHFSIELEAGVDAGITWYQKYECVHCGKQLGNREHGWFALPRLGVNLVVLLGGNREGFEERCDCGKELEDDRNQISEISRDTIVESRDTIVVSKDTIVVRQEQEEPVEETIIESLIAATDTVVNYAQQQPTTAADTVDVRTQIQEVRSRILELERAYKETPSDSVQDIITTLVARQEELAHLDQMSRLKEAILRPIEEFEPYDPEAKVTKEPNSIFMHFDVNITDVDRTYIHNDELMDSIMNVIAEAMADTTIEIKLIKIVGMASFDGSLKGNIRLAGSRGEALKEYIQERFHFGDELFRVYNGGECWSELRWYLEREEFEGKADILSIIDQVLDYDLRERFIKRHNAGRTYEYMRTHFRRYLRNLGTITVYYESKETTR